MDKIWKSVESFPKYEILKKEAKNYFHGCIKIVCATKFNSIYLVEIDFKERKIEFGILTFNHESDKIKCDISEDKSEFIIEKLNEYERNMCEDDILSPGKVRYWCFLSELYNFIERSLTLDSIDKNS